MSVKRQQTYDTTVHPILSKWTTSQTLTYSAIVFSDG